MVKYRLIPPIFFMEEMPFRKTVVGATFIRSLYEANITQMPNPDKEINKEKNYRIIVFMNIDVNIFNKTLAHVI